MKDLLVGIVAVSLAVGLVYGGYWLTKTLSYSFFYEDMVQETVRELVKSDSLRSK